MKTIALLSAILILAGCAAPSASSSASSQGSSQSAYVLTIDEEVALAEPNGDLFKTAYYGLGSVKSLNDFPSKYFKSTDFSLLLPGDSFKAVYESTEDKVHVDWSYPGVYKLSVEKIESEETKLARIVDVSIVDGKVQPIEGIDFSELFASSAINENKEFVELGTLSKGYATVSTKSQGKARAIYTYNPRA